MYFYFAYLRVSEVPRKEIMNTSDYQMLNLTVDTVYFESQSKCTLNTSQHKGNIE